MNKFIISIVMMVTSLFLVNMASCAVPIYQLTEVQGTFLQVPLTHEIYRYSQQTNLQDLEILDAQQSALPYRLVSVAHELKKAEPEVVVDELKFFPVTVDATPDTLRKLHTTQLKMQGENTELTTSDKILNNATPEFYLVGVSILDHDVTSLAIDWILQTNNQYLEIELEATRNLKDWFPLTKSTLIQINEHGQNLKRNHIDVAIAKKDFEFLRLKIVRGADNLHITKITAEQKIGPNQEVNQKVENWRLAGALSKNQDSVYLSTSTSKFYPVTAWEFIRDEVTPVESIAIDIATNSYGDGIKIFSRNAENQNWQLQYQGIWFNTQVGNEWQKSGPINIYPNRDKYWRVELNEHVRGKFTPNLVFGWLPVQLQIITNNKPPYLLAINNDKNVNYNREQIFGQILAKVNPTWVSAGLIQLNVKPDAVMNNHTKLDWKQWLFWVALILAVSVLLAFSLKLFKQLDTNTTR